MSLMMSSCWTLRLETAQRAFDGFAFLHPYFCHSGCYSLPPSVRGPRTRRRTAACYATPVASQQS